MANANNLHDLQRAVIEKETDNRPQEISEVDADALINGAVKGNGLGDVLSLANLDVDELLKDNKSSADYISDEMEKGEKLIRVKQNIPALEAALRKMIEYSRKIGVMADTPEIAELRTKIEAAKEMRVGEEVDETALEIINYRQFYTEVLDAADKVKNLLRGTKEDAEAEVDALCDQYRGFFEKLWKNRHVQEVPREILDNWKKRRISFSDDAFSAKNEKGKKIWCWGIEGDEKSMAVAKAMRRFYANLDTLLRRLQKASEQPAPQAAAVPEPAPESVPE